MNAAGQTYASQYPLLDQYSLIMDELLILCIDHHCLCTFENKPGFYGTMQGEECLLKNLILESNTMSSYQEVTGKTFSLFDYEMPQRKIVTMGRSNGRRQS